MGCFWKYWTAVATDESRILTDLMTINAEVLQAGLMFCTSWTSGGREEDWRRSGPACSPMNSCSVNRRQLLVNSCNPLRRSCICCWLTFGGCDNVTATLAGFVDRWILGSAYELNTQYFRAEDSSAIRLYIVYPLSSCISTNWCSLPPTACRAIFGRHQLPRVFSRRLMKGSEGPTPILPTAYVCSQYGHLIIW